MAGLPLFLYTYHGDEQLRQFVVLDRQRKAEL